MSAPFPGESIQDYRERRKAEMKGTQAAPGAGFEAKKAQVAAQHGSWSGGAPKRAVNLDTARQDADEVERARSQGSGKSSRMVKALDPEAIAAADAEMKGMKDKDVKALSEQRQAMNAASTGRKTVSAEEIALRGTGKEQTPSPAAAPKAAPKAARTPRPATKAGPVTTTHAPVQSRATDEAIGRSAGPAPAVPGDGTKAPRASLLPGGRVQKPESTPAPAPAANPVPTGHADASPNTGSTAADRFDTGGRRGMLYGPGVSTPKPKLGRDITYGVQSPTSPAANTRKSYEAHIAGGGSADSYWAARDAKKATPTTGKATKSSATPASSEPVLSRTRSVPAAPGAAGVGSQPRHVESASLGEAPSRPASSAPPATPPKAPRTSSRPAVVDEGPSVRSAPPKAPSAAMGGGQWQPGTGQQHPMAAHIAKTLASGLSGLNDIGKTPPSAPSMPSAGPSTPSAPVAPAPSRAGRSTGAPRSPEVGGGRGGIHQSGEVNIGGDNHGTITHNHNTYNVVHGDNYGSIGNVEGNAGPGRNPGGRPGGPGNAGGRPGTARGQHGAHADIWVRDATGTHSARAGFDHLTGRTGGHGERLATPAATTSGTHGGSQRPLANSSRVPTFTPHPQQSPSGTGTTHNWQGPAGGVQHPASGIGTARPTPRPGFHPSGGRGSRPSGGPGVPPLNRVNWDGE